MRLIEQLIPKAYRDKLLTPKPEASPAV